MTTQRDVSKFSDISKGVAEADGTFKRKASSFRRFIEKGGEFEPEKGEYRTSSQASRKTLQALAVGQHSCLRTIPPSLAWRFTLYPLSWSYGAAGETMSCVRS